jgi:hypothetical protein
LKVTWWVWTSQLKAQPSKVAMICLLLMLPTGSALQAAEPQKTTPKVQLSNADLNSVSFATSNDGWAVGYADPQDGEQTVCVHWDGNSWTRFPCLGSKKGTLSAVKAIATDDVWAVGQDADGSLTVHWDGKKWSKVPLDPTNKNPVVLMVLDAVTSKDVWAGGITASGDKAVGVIEHWDGKAWKISYLSRAPTVPMIFIPSMSAAAADNAWAILLMDRKSDEPGPDLLHWDGTGWKPFYLPGQEIYSVWGIVAESRDSAWAVGANEDDHNMTAHWDGKGWRIVPSVRFADHDQLRTIARVSAKELWAVGTTNLGGGGSIFFEHWDGSKWELIDPKQGGEINSLSVVSSTDIWAVGTETTQTFGDATHKPVATTDALVGHWDGKTWTFSKPFAGPGSAP